MHCSLCDVLLFYSSAAACGGICGKNAGAVCGGILWGTLMAVTLTVFIAALIAAGFVSPPQENLNKVYFC